MNQASVMTQPGHWVLAKLGKKVLRPGGIAATKTMLSGTKITSSDKVVELAPGLGITSKMCLSQNPKTYRAIEQNPDAALEVKKVIKDPNFSTTHSQCLQGDAEETGLESGSASVLYCEAMLTMQSKAKRKRIVEEAFRVLESGGRYAIHELCLVNNETSEDEKHNIQHALAQAIKVSARPDTIGEWQALLEEVGFIVHRTHQFPMGLLSPKRVLQDEGVFRTIKFVFNLMRFPEERSRVLGMREVFQKYKKQLGAVVLIAEKPEVGNV